MTTGADSGSPAPPIRGGAITITRSDMDTAIADGVLTADQAGQLWNRFAAQAQSRPKFDAAHVAYYAGAVIVLGAMGWFLTEAWMQLGGAAITVIALAYAGAFWLAGETLWKKGLTTPGGLLFTLAVWMVPLARTVVVSTSGHGSAAACPRAAALYVLAKGTFDGMPEVCR